MSHSSRNGTTRAFTLEHVVSFEETNLMGNVYFARYFSWQGRCREMFLREKSPNVLEELSRDLRLITIDCGCEFYRQLGAFDVVSIELRLAYQRQNRIGLRFTYRCDGQLIARGHHAVGCMRLVSGELLPTDPPPALLAALEPYREIGSRPSAPSLAELRI